MCPWCLLLFLIQFVVIVLISDYLVIFGSSNGHCQFIFVKIHYKWMLFFHSSFAWSRLCLSQRSHEWRIIINHLCVIIDFLLCSLEVVFCFRSLLLLSFVVAFLSNFIGEESQLFNFRSSLCGLGPVGGPSSFVILFIIKFVFIDLLSHHAFSHDKLLFFQIHVFVCASSCLFLSWNQRSIIIVHILVIIDWFPGIFVCLSFSV